jgi:hypothetical protein
MSNVREVVIETMRDSGLASYEGRATPVIEALTAREAEIAERLTEGAIDMGADRTQVRLLLTEVGLLTPEPEVSQSNGNGHGDTDVMAVLREIQSDIAGMKQFARQHGFRG